jgi:exopolyphosphatase/guanosine-5'-triphosphate,3'-diphosphate pyrophosphatase
MVITRMGERLDRRELSGEGLERTRRVLERFARSIESHGGVEGMRIAGTSAARDASNISSLREIVSEIFAVEPEILSGEEEARASFIGATYDLDDLLVKGKTIMVVDVGGGSTEVIVGRGEEIILDRSLDVGCVRMSERFLSCDPPSVGELAAMEKEIKRVLEPLLEMLEGEEIDLCIGLAGTVTTLAGIKLGLRKYDGALVHGTWLTRDEIEDMYLEMAARDLEARKSYMGLEPGRADVILGGSAIFLILLRGLGMERLLVSEKDILDGLIIEGWRKRHSL